MKQDQEPLLSCQGLAVHVGNRALIEDISIRVAMGEVVAVLGPSGAGKSTLFRALAGELTPSRGRIEISGTRVDAWPLWRRARVGLGYLPQTPSVLQDLSVEQNLLTFARLTKREPRVLSRASEVGLGARLHVKARNISGGERRRLELARVLFSEPTLLLCDEPFSGVDPLSAGLLAELIRERAARGAGVLISDHRVREALALSHRGLLLVDGRLELEVAAVEFASHPLVRERYLG